MHISNQGSFTLNMTRTAINGKGKRKKTKKKWITIGIWYVETKNALCSSITNEQ